MSQGTINMPQLQPAQITAIANALGVASDVFGIGTGGAKKRLLEAQAAEAQTKADISKSQQSVFQSYLDRAAKARAPQQAPAPGPNEAMQQPAQASPSEPTGVSAEDLSNPILAPMLEPMLKAQSTAAGLKSSALEGMIKGAQVADLPLQHKKLETEISNAQASGAKTRQEIGFGQREEGRKEQGQLREAQNDFLEKYPGVSDTIKSIPDLNQASKLLLSGNKQGEQIGQANAVLLGTGLKRYSDELQKMGNDPAIVTGLANDLAKKWTGHKTPQEIKALHDVINLLGGEANASIDSTLNSHSQMVGARMNVDPNSVKSLIGNGLPRYQETQTALKLNPATRKSVLYRRDDKGWKAITSGE